MAATKTLIALYDLDKTITRIPTYTPFLINTAWRYKPYRLLLLPILLPALLAYTMKLINRARLKEWMWALLLGKLQPDIMAQAVAIFVEKTHLKNLCPGAQKQIQHDKQTGARLVLATASYAAYAGPIAHALGFSDIIGTGLQQDVKGRFGPRLIGANCYGAAKLAMVEAWLAAERLQRCDLYIRFYSDSATDAPLFEWVDEPVAVNASRRLRRLARTRGWPLQNWRKVEA
jgi:HAD superfamily hydrolase (TIGR01490 family)